MKKYIGDISRQDAELLEHYASLSRSVLEFGVGASTQVIAQSIPAGATFVSLDTEDEWMARTADCLARLGVERRCRMTRYSEWPALPDRFDLVFDDGKDALRREFAMRSFPMLVPGGAMLLHDTRRVEDVRNVTTLVETFFEEVEHVHLNKRVAGVSSNITVVVKKKREPYVDWNAAEGRQAWAVGYGRVPDEFWAK